VAVQGRNRQRRHVVTQVDRFVRGKGGVNITQYMSNLEKVMRKYLLLLSSGRVLSQGQDAAETALAK
jgi:hypothetical protein